MRFVESVTCRQTRRFVLRVVLLLLAVTSFTFLFTQRSPGSPVSQSLLSPVELGTRLQGPVSGEDPRVTKILLQQYLSPPSSQPYNLSTNPYYQKAKTFGSWGFIRTNVRNLFGDHREGFFVEAGALDGERLSNTLWLEQELGWTGLLVEPNPKNFMNLERKRRKAWISHTCLSPRPYPEEQVIVSLSRKVQMENEFRRVLDDFRGSSYLMGVTLATHIYDSLLDDADKAYSVVQCFPLVSYLLALNTTTVDFLSLDIQGTEKDVLQNIPWDKVNIRVIVAEIVFHESFDQAFVNEMESKKYKLIYFRGEDYVFVKNDDPLMDKVKSVMLYIDGPTEKTAASTEIPS